MKGEVLGLERGIRSNPHKKKEEERRPKKKEQKNDRRNQTFCMGRSKAKPGEKKI